MLLPNSPNAYATKVRELIDCGTPRKKRALSAINIQPVHKDREVLNTVLKGVKEVLNESKSCSKKSRTTRGSISSVKSRLTEKKLARCGSKWLCINRKFRSVQQRKARKDTISPAMKELINAHYTSCNISTERPEIRFGGKRLMSVSSRQAFKMFKKEHTEATLGLTKLMLM